MRFLILCASSLAVPFLLLAAGTVDVVPGGMSPAEAVSQVRKARAAGETGVFTIRIGKGVHRLVEPLVLTAEDHDIVFEGERGAILSGGVRLGPWRPAGDGVWEADAPKHRSGETGFFDQLWVGGCRAPCARIPDEGYLHAREMVQVPAGTDAGGVRQYETKVTFTNELVDALAGIPADELRYVQMGIIHKWCYGKRPLKSFDARTRTTCDRSNDGFASWKQWGWETMFHFENVRAGFDAPGEWFLDMKAGKVLYRPRPGEDPNRIEIIAPVPGLSNLVRVRGRPEANELSRNVVFRNLSFAYTSATPPESGANAPAVIVQYQAAALMDGTVDLTGAHGYSFEGCRIAHTGNYGMKFRDGCVSNRIVRCGLEDLGAGGIWMGAASGWSDRSGALSRRVMRPESPTATAFNLIEDTFIVRGGRYNPEGTGIALTHCSDTCVRHCDIHDFYYTGISVGLTWGYGGSVAQRNEIAYNLIYDLGKGLMSDMGGVYTLGTSYGTTVHDNVIHDVSSYDYGGWGLYTDEGSEGIVMERNLCWNTTDGGFHQHYGTGCVIRNNIFAWNRIRGAVRTQRALVDSIPSSLDFINNIVVVREGPLVGDGVGNVGGAWCGNLWWDVRGEDAAAFDGMKWKEWRRTEKGRGSRFADPKFRNSRTGDFVLMGDSPAYAMGFKAFDASRAGVRRSGRGGPRILGHRGTRGEYQENCAEAMSLALGRGVTGFETDIRMTKDGHLVIMHDADVARVSDGKGVVEELTLAELKKFRLNNSSDAIPTMEEMLAPLRGRTEVFIELEMKSSDLTKPARLDDYLEKIYATAKRMLVPGTYAFTSFDADYLKRMHELHPDARTGLINGTLTEEMIAKAKRLGCSQIAPVLKGATRGLVDKAHAEGLAVTLWMVQNAADWEKARELGADCTTSDYPILLGEAVKGKRKKVVAMDLDATLCQHRSPIPPENLKALDALMKKYRCVMVGAGNAPRIYRQMGNYPIEISGNYGMQESEVRDGKFVIVRAVTNEVDRAFFREKTDYLRKKYGYAEYEGEPLEFHASGMVTFGLLGTSPSAEHKVAFDPDRRKRRAMYKEVCEIFKDYSVYIGGSTSFDFAGREYNKYDATVDWAKRHGYAPEDIVFIGDDFADGGGDSHVRIKGMDHIVINDYRKFASAVSVLLK